LVSLSHDECVVVALDVAFATLVTAHVTIVAGLASRPPRWRAAVALVLPPLAPYWAARAGMHARWVTWVAAAAAYAVCLWLAYR
jgi:hypothetical protein